MHARLINDGEDQIVVFPPGLSLSSDHVLLTQEREAVRVKPIANDEALPEQIET